MFKIFQDLVIFTFSFFKLNPMSLCNVIDSNVLQNSASHHLILDSVVVRIPPVERETGVQFPAGEEFLFDPQNWSKFKSKTSFELRRTSQIQFRHSQTSPMPLRSENLLRITPIFIKICDFWPIFFIFLLKPPFFYAFSEDSVKVRPEFHAGLG